MESNRGILKRTVQALMLFTSAISSVVSLLALLARGGRFSLLSSYIPMSVLVYSMSSRWMGWFRWTASRITLGG